MAIKIENSSSAKLARSTEANIDKILNSFPREHLRGIERLRLVDSISDPRLRTLQRNAVRGL